MDTGTGVPVGYLVLQCTNAGQVLARGGQLAASQQCVAARNQVLMSATPIVDNEEGTLEFKTNNGNNYIKVYDPALNATRWKLWNLPILSPGNSDTGGDMSSLLSQPADQASMGLQGAEAQAVNDGPNLLLPKLGGLTSFGQKAAQDKHGGSPTPATTSEGSALRDSDQGKEVTDSPKETTVTNLEASSASSGASATSKAPRYMDISTMSFVAPIIMAFILRP